MTEEKTISSFADLYQYIYSLGDHAFTSVVYRGVRCTGYELVPRIGRLQHFNYPKNPNAPDDREMLTIFKQQALPYLDRIPQSNWDWLAIGQHYGLPTRLLDWTRNPLVACFFAVENELKKGDSVIYALHGGKKIDMEKESDPFNIGNDVYKVIPAHVTSRIIAQAGLFTIHPEPLKPLKTDSGIKIDRLIIPNKIRRELKVMLYKFGIHSATIFPDLSGLSKLIEWRRTKGH